MRIGFFGGTFNPPHNGHLNLARHWSARLGLDTFLMIPTGRPPHKEPSDVPGEMRLEMCRIAAAESGGLVEVSDFEVRREGKSYSVITLEALHERYPDSDIYMVMGADMFVTLETWYHFDRLRELATFCTMPRDGISAEELNAFRERLAALGCRGIVADEPELDISSSAIRERVQRGQPITGLVPAGVERYIAEHGLYQGLTDGKD
jgi:nicotinate-nucleotide adenylyltransferase